MVKDKIIKKAKVSSIEEFIKWLEDNKFKYYDFNNIKDINKGYYYIDVVDINIFDYDLECSLSICFEDGKFNMCVDR